MHIHQLTRLMRNAWEQSGHDWEEFILRLDAVAPRLADRFELGINKKAFIAVHMGQFQTALREVC